MFYSALVFSISCSFDLYLLDKEAGASGDKYGWSAYEKEEFEMLLKGEGDDQETVLDVIAPPLTVPDDRYL